MSGCSGSSGSGALTQLIAQGAVDAYLTSTDNVTCWRYLYKKHTNFAMESISQPFNTAVAFGAEAQITLNRNGDLIYFMYVVIDLPGIVACDKSEANGYGGAQFPTYMVNACSPCQLQDEKAVAPYISGDFTDASSDMQAAAIRNATNAYGRANHGAAPMLECCDDAEDCPAEMCPELNNCWCHWVNAIGQWLIRQARIVIGGSTIDTVYNDFLFMWEELTGKSGRRLTEMIGKRYTRTQLICDSRKRRTLYVPLPFWFTQHSGSSLSLASLQFHGVQLHVEFERLERCIVCSSGDVVVKSAASNCCLSANDLSACLETTYIYLDNMERDRFATTHFEILINQTQAFFMQTTNQHVRMQLSFNHPCVELIWACRRQCQERCNNWFNYSGLMGMDPMETCTLALNNQARFGRKGHAYFRLVQPYQHHSNIPDCFIYVYSFSLHPEDISPSGSCNFSRIDNLEMQLTLQEGLAKEQVTVIVFCRNWNVLRFREGLGGLGFAN